jgi:chromosome segregation ATPase
MATKTIDFEATRAKLQEELGEAQEELSSVEDRLGGLTLDVELGAGSQADVDRARTQRQQLTSRVSELQAALEALDDREAAHVAAEAEAERVAAEAERERLLTTAQAASAQAAELVDRLAVAVADALEAERKAVAIARRLDLRPGSTQRGRIGDDLAVLMGSRLHALVPGFLYQRADKGDEAGARLRSVL